MNRWTFAAAALVAFSVKASAGQFKSSTFDQASDLASGQSAPAVYDGSRSQPALEQIGMTTGRDITRDAVASPASVTAAAARGAAIPRFENVPMPQGMEIVSVPRRTAPKSSSRDMAAPLGALMGTTAGLGIGLGLSKILT